MRVAWAGLAATILAAAVLAGCGAPADTRDAPADALAADGKAAIPAAPLPTVTAQVAQDPQGDATEFNSDAVAENGDRHADWVCATATPYLPNARDGCNVAPSDASRQRVGGVPANPALDLVGVEWTESPTNLTVTFVVAGWDGEWASLVPRPGSAVAYALAWGNATLRCGGTFAVGFADLPSGIDARAAYSGNGAGCRTNVYGAVAYRPGTPARFEASFLWRDVPWSSPGPVGVTRPYVFRDEAAAGPGGFFSVRGEPVHTPQDNVGFAGYIVDLVPELANLTILHGPSGPQPAVEYPSQFADAAIAATGDRPDLDLLAVRLADTPESLTIRLELAKVGDAADQIVAFQFDGRPDARGTPNIYVAQAEARQGTWNMTASKLVAPDLHVEPLPFQATVEAGNPGAFVWTFARNDLEPLGRGDRLERVAAFAGLASVRDLRPVPGTQEGYTISVSPRGHDVLQGHLYLSSSPPASLDVLSVTDAAADAPPVAAAPGVAVASQAAELLRAEIRVASPDHARVTVVLADVEDLAVPAGYEAVFVGAAVEAAATGLSSVGLYQTNTESTFFCGADRTILAPQPGHPLAGKAFDIAGHIVTGDAAAGAGGLLVFDVPVACFGAAAAPQDGFELDVERFKAGSYLVRSADAGGLVETGDTVESTESASLTFRAAQPEQPGFWARPFGMDNFWDIFALVATGIGVLGSGLLVLRRRSRLKHYLRRIEEARRKAVGPREQALAKCAADLERDLLRHAIPTDHYAIVESRLDPLLARTRASILAEEFPGAGEEFLLRAEQLMADGELSVQDRVRLLGMVHLGPGTKARLGKRLAAWSN